MTADQRDPQEVKLARERAVPTIDAEKIFYLSGPMAGYPDLNFQAFEKAAHTLRVSGLHIVSPHELKLPGEPDPGKEGLDYLANDFAVMSSACQGIILLKGWPRSRGACAELDIALALKWPVYYYDEFQLIDMNKDGVN
jgi:hypothetical protein